MHPLFIIATAMIALGFLLSIAARLTYEPPIQRYLERMGLAPTCLLHNLSWLHDYLNARRVAQKWGHRPEFLKRYERLLATALSFVASGLAVFLLGLLLGSSEKG